MTFKISGTNVITNNGSVVNITDTKTNARTFFWGDQGINSAAAIKASTPHRDVLKYTRNITKTNNATYSSVLTINVMQHCEVAFGNTITTTGSGGALRWRRRRGSSIATVSEIAYTSTMTNSWRYVNVTCRPGDQYELSYLSYWDGQNAASIKIVNHLFKVNQDCPPPMMGIWSTGGFV